MIKLFSMHVNKKTAEEKRAELFEKMFQVKKQDGTFDSYSKRVAKRRYSDASNEDCNR